MDDLISRQAAIQHLKKRLYETALNNITEHPYYEEMADNRVDVWLNELPSVERHGRWIVEHGVLSDGIYGDIGKCSVCGVRLRDYEWGYCPNCGAKMDEVGE